MFISRQALDGVARSIRIPKKASLIYEAPSSLSGGMNPIVPVDGFPAQAHFLVYPCPGGISARATFFIMFPGEKSLTMNKKDTIFSEAGDGTPFEFNETVASVFDDMITRSVPLYREIIRQQSRLSVHFYQPGTKIYDLGCSNGNFAVQFISDMGKKDFDLAAVDNSAPMLDFFKSRISGFTGHERVTAILSDIRDITYEKSSVVIANLTLQFIPVASREALIKKIYASLIPGGIFLITEKTVNRDSNLANLQQEFYYRLKEENGYSKLEITRKREALENVLIPEAVEDHIERFKNAGFNAIEIWLKWFHFAAFICRKES